VTDVCCQIFFKSLLLLQFFSDSRKLAHDQCAIAQKTGTDFRNYDVKIVGNFFLILNLDLVSETAAEVLSRPAGLCCYALTIGKGAISVAFVRPSVCLSVCPSRT